MRKTNREKGYCARTNLICAGFRNVSVNKIGLTNARSKRRSFVFNVFFFLSQKSLLDKNRILNEYIPSRIFMQYILAGYWKSVETCFWG